MITGRGIQVPLAGQSTTSAETRYDNGWAVLKSVFGKMIDELYEQSPKDQLHIERFLSANCFCDLYTRRGLDIKIRKLVTLSILLAMGGLDAQVKGHMEGNINIGNGRETLLDVITQLLPRVGYPRP